MSLATFITDYRRKNKAHDWRKPYSPKCICPGCHIKPYFDGKTYYSLCSGCLKEKNLGPFMNKGQREDYAAVFWLIDFENRYELGKEERFLQRASGTTDREFH
ncbi:hypothetical protein SAMN05660710_01278 [Paracoccus tibetensis]|uniref:Uncharacterized protein n=1 Tax=Paracoccus tibetensis TaxID=336292 RepID=A0A1G5F7W2_9RHOB|nr:hypothetical protein SAMN05660710_01278 [Paracoccus tibetensis]